MNLDPKEEKQHHVAVVEFLRESIFADIWIFVVFDKGKCAASIGTIRFFSSRVSGKCNNPPEKNCETSCSKTKIPRRRQNTIRLS